MKPIGTYKFLNPFFLAPMEAVNCASFRLVCKRRGAGLIFTDMIDADVFMEYVRTHSLKKAVETFINPQKEEYPLVIQLGGGNIQTLLQTIKAVEEYATIIDYNVGCPLGYMLGKKGGAYLLKHPNQLEKILVQMRRAIKKPFTIKIRSGWDEQSINAVEIAKMAQKIGIDALTIHPRTRKQKYSLRADWSLARKIAEVLSIPVILSGDVTNAYMAHMAFAHTKCDYIMVARGAKYNPSVFTELNEYYFSKKIPTKPTQNYLKNSQTVQKDFLEFVELYQKIEHRNKFSEIQDHANWSIRECKNNSELTQKLLIAQTVSELIEIVRQAEFT